MTSFSDRRKKCSVSEGRISMYLCGVLEGHYFTIGYIHRPHDKIRFVSSWKPPRDE